jgi:hypothetical protein
VLVLDQRNNPLQAPTDQHLQSTHCNHSANATTHCRRQQPNKTPQSRKNGLEILPYGALLLLSKPFASLDIPLFLSLFFLSLALGLLID